MNERFQGFRTAANDNFKHEIQETFVPDLAKVASIRRALGLARESGDRLLLWSDANIAETRDAMAGFTLKDAIREINAATEEAVLKRPTYYSALIDMLDEQTLEMNVGE